MAVKPNSAQTPPVLRPETRIGSVTLAVSSLLQSIDFYTSVLGMAVLRINAEGETKFATLGVGETSLLTLEELPGAIRQPAYSTGLYHVALLVPSRPDLGQLLLNLRRTEYPIGGFGDHYVSEAIYLSDPDGNGLELYRDRPRDEWEWNGAHVLMGTELVDVDDLIKSVSDPDAPFGGMPDGTRIGHIHLRVGDIPRADTFYHMVLGFEVTAKIPAALFVSAGRYHHHIGLNTWQSRGAPPPPADSVGLRQFSIFVPDAEARDQLAWRLDVAGIAYERHDADILLNDPWQNAIRVIPEKRKISVSD